MVLSHGFNGSFRCQVVVIMTSCVEQTTVQRWASDGQVKRIQR